MKGVGLALALAVPAWAQEPQTESLTPTSRFQERVEVARVLLDVRIVDTHGAPLLGLTPADVRVSVDGRGPVSVESLTWISGATPYAEGLGPELAAATGGPIAPPGRLIVFFFQKNLFVASRVSGLLRMKAHAAELLGSLAAGDRVAVLSHDSQLRLWTDFTGDRKKLRRIVERSILFEAPPAQIEASAFPSLLASYDAAAARRAASPEAALLVIADALSALPGAKSLAFFGWGLGSMAGGSVSMAPEYDAARRALIRGRVVVLSLDITDADFHTLEVGLEQLAGDTGGFYVKTHVFPSLAMRRLERALAGYYTLAFEKPKLPPGHHKVKVELVARKGTVLSAPSYVD